MNDEQAAVNELEAARDRHRARQAGRDALAMATAAFQGDTEGAERMALSVETPRSVAYVAACYTGGLLQAFADLSEDPGAADEVLRRLSHQIEEMELP